MHQFVMHFVCSCVLQRSRERLLDYRQNVMLRLGTQGYFRHVAGAFEATADFVVGQKIPGETFNEARETIEVLFFGLTDQTTRSSSTGEPVHVSIQPLDDVAHPERTQGANVRVVQF